MSVLDTYIETHIMLKALQTLYQEQNPFTRQKFNIFTVSCGVGIDDKIYQAATSANIITSRDATTRMGGKTL